MGILDKALAPSRKNRTFALPIRKGMVRQLIHSKTSPKFFKEKLGKSKSLRTFALPNRKKLIADNDKGLTPTQNFILIENKIWKVKKASYLCTPNHKQGLQTARKELETQLARLLQLEVAHVL